MIASLEVSYVYTILASTTLVLAASYSLWLGKRVLFGASENQLILNMKDLKLEEFWPLLILIISIIILGIKPGLILDISLASSEHIISIINGRSQ